MPASKRNGNVWPKILLGIIGFFVGAWILVTSLGASATREWEAYAASLRAKGQPLTFAEIEARRAVVPDDKNSARVLEAVFPALSELRGGGVTLDSLAAGAKENGDFFSGRYRGRVEAARAFLSNRADILEKLALLKEMPTGHFALQYDKKNPLLTLLPHLAHLRAASKLLRVNSAIHLVDGDMEGAMDDFALQCRLAGAVSDEPTLISRLVQIAIQAEAVRTVEDILRTGTVKSESLRPMAEELRQIRKNGTMKWSLEGERAFFVETCEAMVRGTVSNQELCQVGAACNFFPGPMLRLPAFLVRSNELRGAKMYGSLFDALDDPKGMLAAARKLEGEVPTLPWTQTLVKILMPSLTRSVILNTKIAAHLDTALAALAAEQYRMVEGMLPSTLEELVPKYLAAVPTDPFDGKPLRLAKTTEGIVIYSVDEDGMDDGGLVALPQQEKKLKRAPDVGFRLNDVDHRGVLLVDDPPTLDD